MCGFENNGFDFNVPAFRPICVGCTKDLNEMGLLEDERDKD